MPEPTRRVVASGLTVDRQPETTRLDAHRDFVTSFVLLVGRPLWGYRVEIDLIGAVLASVLGLSLLVHPVIAVLLVAGLLGALLSRPSLRRRLVSLLRRARVRREWARACRYAFLATTADRVPEPVSIAETPGGEVLTVRMPPSMSTVPLADAVEVLASGLAVQEVRVERDRRRADMATVQIVRRDPLGEPAPLAWPHLSSHRLSVWDPVPVGIDEMGETVLLSLPFRMVLFGAETGGGKSVAMSQLVATAALDPDCELTLLDGKQVELAFWRSCARAVAGPSVPEATAVLSELRVEMDRRYGALLAEGRRKIDREDYWPLQVVVIDELAFYLTMGERKENQEFERVLRDLVARGRAAGIVVIAATQKPSHDIIPTSIRDLFAIRWALRCTTPQASDTVLGQGWASRGFSASEIDVATRGVGFLLHEGGEPTRTKSFYLSDDDLRTLARRATALRRGDSSASEGHLSSSAVVGDDKDPPLAA